MKKIRKTMSIVSAAAILASIAAMPVSAAGINTYSVSYETLTSAITTDDGSTVPAGAVAVTMSIDNNTGFTENALALNTGDATVLTNDEGKPVIQDGSVLAGAMTGCAIVDDTVCITVASAEVCDNDGELFTIYLIEEDSERMVQMVEPSTACAVVHNVSRAAMGTYYVGDADGNGECNSVDASLILMAIKDFGSSMTVREAAANKEKYFPDAAVADAPDANEDGRIASVDAQDILDYAALVGAGYDVSNELVGQERPYV